MVLQSFGNNNINSNGFVRITPSKKHYERYCCCCDSPKRGIVGGGGEV